MKDFKQFREEIDLQEAASVSVTVQATAPADKKYAVTEIHPRTSPRGRTKWKDISYHSSEEEAKAAADAHAKKNNLHRMKSSVAEEVEGAEEDKDQINEMNPMLVRDGLQVVIDFLSQYPQATALTAGAAGAAIVAKLVKNAWKSHKELEQLKQDVRNWNTQKLHSNKNVSANGGKVAKIIQAEIERRKQGVTEEVESVEEAVKRNLSGGSKVSHGTHGKGTVVMVARGGGSMVPKDSAIVKFSSGKKTVKIRDLTLHEDVELDEEAKTQNPYHAGYDAHGQKKTRQHNPYKEGSEGASMWAKGWEHASDGKPRAKFTNEEVERIEEGPYSSGQLKPTKSMVDQEKKAVTSRTSTVRARDKKGVYTATMKDGKEVSRVYEESDVDESFAADFLAMAKQKNPNARISTADQRSKEAEELAKKRAGLKPAHAAPTSNPRPLGGHDPKSNRSYSEEVEASEEKMLSFLEHALDEAPYMGKGNHRPGWMLRADPELARKVKANIDAAKLRQKYMGKTADEIAKMKKEEAELEEGRGAYDELARRMGTSSPGFNKTPAGKAREQKRRQEHLKGQMQFTQRMGGLTGPKGKLPEEVELDEAMSPQQEMDFSKMMAGAMSRAAYDAKWKKPLKSAEKVIYGKNKKDMKD